MFAGRLLALLGAVLVVAPLLPSHAVAADAKTGFLERVHKDADGKEAKYVLFVPHDYKGDKPYPLILFLHGAGERSGGKKQPVEVGIGPAIKKRAKDFPCLVIIPQAEKTWQADSPDAKRALDILTEVQKEYKVDPKRVYLTGLSMGGAGTWSLALAKPDRWAAIVPLCGRGEVSKAEKLKQLPCWCFCGDADRPATVENARKMVEAIKKAGGEPKYTEYPGVGHNCWDKAYATQELYDWLLKQQQK